MIGSRRLRNFGKRARRRIDRKIYRGCGLRPLTGVKDFVNADRRGRRRPDFSAGSYPSRGASLALFARPGASGIEPGRIMDVLPRAPIPLKPNSDLHKPTMIWFVSKTKSFPSAVAQYDTSPSTTSEPCPTKPARWSCERPSPGTGTASSKQIQPGPFKASTARPA